MAPTDAEYNQVRHAIDTLREQIRAGRSTDWWRAIRAAPMDQTEIVAQIATGFDVALISGVSNEQVEGFVEAIKPYGEVMTFVAVNQWILGYYAALCAQPKTPE